MKKSLLTLIWSTYQELLISSTTEKVSYLISKNRRMVVNFSLSRYQRVVFSVLEIISRLIPREQPNLDLNIWSMMTMLDQLRRIIREQSYSVSLQVPPPLTPLEKLKTRELFSLEQVSQPTKA